MLHSSLYNIGSSASHHSAVGRWVVGVFVLCAFSWSAVAQSGVVEQLILQGKLAQVSDSLSSAQMSEADRHYYSLWLQVEEGRPNGAMTWYNGLRNSDKRKFRNRLLATKASIVAYDLERADQLMGELEKVRLRDEESLRQREELKLQLDQAHRLLRNSQSVSVTDTVRGSKEEVLRILQERTAHLGQVGSTSYTSPSGDLRWQVREGGEEEAPAFIITHQLGDGSWDEANAQVVVVNGLSSGGKLSFPFLKSDGRTLYFSYSGANTFGRADLYVSRYNREEHTLLVPQQLPLPFNSTSGDWLYVIDEGQDLIWLLTDRGLPTGQAMGYGIVASSVRAMPDTVSADERASKALLASPVLVGRSVVQSPLLPNGDQPAKELPNVYFWLGNNPVQGIEDLPNENARRLFQHYLSLYQEQERDQAQLAELREGLRPFAPSQQVASQRNSILALERVVASREVQLKALRNEVLSACGVK